MRVGVFDLGSTSFQLLVSEAEPDGSLVPILRDRVILNLGAEVASTGRVRPGLLDRAVAVVRRFRDLAERAGAELIVPVATAAFREAVNRPELAGEIEAAIGMPIRVLSGDLEARATVAGIRASVAPEPEPWLAFDLGGGSLEIAVVDGGDVAWTDTFALGAARIAATMVSSDPMTREERRAIRRAARELLEPAAAAAGSPAASTVVLAGGTAGALARLLAGRRWATLPQSLNAFAFDLGELEGLSKLLCGASEEERLRLPGIDQRRVDLLPAGSVVLTAALAVFGAAGASHSEWGLREGVILQELGVAPPPSLRDLRRAEVSRLGRRWHAEVVHPAVVRRLALRLFDATVPLHGLGPTERELLGHACEVHDIGVRISPDKHHRHGAYLVQHGGLRGFSPVEVAQMSSMIRFHRGSGPRSGYPPYAGLSGPERTACRVLTGILRIAHGLGRGGEDDVHDVSIDVAGQELVIVATGTSNPEAAVAEAAERADVLARALDRKIRFAVASGSPAPRA
jgi:exopolyphosphatase/guanosine-5'-triphosphate,3'-diphosphate pyrophosphatase